jgi:hypothetical protein
VVQLLPIGIPTISLMTLFSNNVKLLSIRNSTTSLMFASEYRKSGVKGFWFRITWFSTWPSSFLWGGRSWYFIWFSLWKHAYCRCKLCLNALVHKSSHFWRFKKLAKVWPFVVFLVKCHCVTYKWYWKCWNSAKLVSVNYFNKYPSI